MTWYEYGREKRRLLKVMCFPGNRPAKIAISTTNNKFVLKQDVTVALVYTMKE